MCFYEPPLFLGTPDLSAAMICALPLGASATQWRELLSASIGLAVAFLAAHACIIALDHEFPPPSRFYWLREQATAVPFVLAAVTYELVVIYAAAHFVRGLWRAEHLRALGYLLLTLALVAAAIGSIAYLALDAHAFEASAAGFSTSPVGSSQPVVIVPTNCVFPPFGEGVVGYTMLAVLVIFEVLVAVGIADALNRKLMPNSEP